MRDREREDPHYSRKGCHDRQTNKNTSFSSNGEWHADGTVMVGKYTQTKQRWLRGRTVKSGHDRHYKKKPLPCIEEKG